MSVIDERDGQALDFSEGHASSAATHAVDLNLDAMLHRETKTDEQRSALLHEYRYKNDWYQLPIKGVFDMGDIVALVDPAVVKHEVVDAPSVNWDMRYDHEKTHGKILRLHDLDRDKTFEMIYQKLNPLTENR